MPETQELTTLLNAWSDGDTEAGDRLLQRLYRELRAISSHRLSRFSGSVTMQATELVHEAFIRLSGHEDVSWTNRAHFLAIASTVMRRILLDQARHRRRQKRDRSLESPIDDNHALASPERDKEVIELDEALEALAGIDERQARVVELRYFGGMTLEEAALALDVSPATVKRDWAVARAWLYRRLQSSENADPGRAP